MVVVLGIALLCVILRLNCSYRKPIPNVFDKRSPVSATGDVRKSAANFAKCLVENSRSDQATLIAATKYRTYCTFYDRA